MYMNTRNQIPDTRNQEPDTRIPGTRNQITRRNTVHIIGSKAMGGAERFFFRLISSLNDAGERATALVRRGSRVEQAVPENCPYCTVRMDTTWDPISRFSIKKAIKRIKPQIVQTYMGRATRLTRLPYGKLPIHVARLGGYYSLHCYGHAHAWIGNTKGVCDYLIAEGFPSERVYYVPNFVDLPLDTAGLGRERARCVLGLGAEDWILLSLGRFIPVKGHRYLIRAFSMLPEKISGRRLCLVILGDGPLFSEYKDLLKDTSLAQRVHFPGWVKDPAPYYEAADLVVFPSLEQETLGNVVLESWAHRRAVLATEFRGAREIAHHGQDAFLVPCEDAEAISQGIKAILTQDGLRHSLGEMGRERVESEFSRDRVVGLYRGLYRELARKIAGVGA